MKTFCFGIVLSIFAVSFLSAQTPGAGNILYVKKGSSGNGTSWEDALGELSEALSWASGWDPANEGVLRIWVAKGKYLPTSDETDRNASFQLVNGVHVYGGFLGDRGTEGDLYTRDWEKNETILSGDIDRNDKAQVINDPNTQIIGKNSYAVVNGSHAEGRAVLDGFIITGGHVDENSKMKCGGGIYNSNGKPTLRNLIVTGNISLQGDSICNVDSGSPELTNVKIVNNR